MHTYTTPLAPCPHGERTDRTTSDGRPLCALCRIHQARQTHTDPNTPDWAALAAGDDTQDEDILRTTDEPPTDTGALLLGDLFGRDSGNRFEAMLQRWTEQQPERTLF